MSALVPLPLLLSILLLFFCSPSRGQACQNAVSPAQTPCHNVSTVQRCGAFYSLSAFPNLVTSSLQEALTYLTFYRQEYENCSHYAPAFLCLALLPSCQNTGPAELNYRPPCRRFCQRVRGDCGPIDVLRDAQCLLSECDRFPETNCVAQDDPLVVATLPPNPSVSPPNGGKNASATNNETICPPPELSFFSNEAKTFARGWVAFWSVVCFLSTLVTVLTFCLDTSRFQYPWRPVVYLALCFNVHALGYFLALVVGPDNVICPGGEYVQARGRWTWEHTPCILVFGLLYYSMLAAFLWWLVLTLSWLLSSSFKWSNEAISQFALFFHTAAWILPLIMTVSLLAARVVSADELTGTCFIVRLDTHSSLLALLLGLVVPLSVFLCLGTLFLLIGFIGLLKIRQFMVHRGKERESVILEKLMIRIGIFVAIYIIPATVVIGCFIYELQARPGWHPVEENCSDCSRPNTAVFMVRVFMFLLIGALTGVWIWSRKTLTSWRHLPQKLRGCLFSPSQPEVEAETNHKMDSLNSRQTSRGMPSPYIESGTEFTA